MICFFVFCFLVLFGLQQTPSILFLIILLNVLAVDVIFLYKLFHFKHIYTYSIQHLKHYTVYAGLGLYMWVLIYLDSDTVVIIVTLFATTLDLKEKNQNVLSDLI